METIDLILSIVVSILSILWVLGYSELNKIKVELKQINVKQSWLNNINDIKKSTINIWVDNNSNTEIMEKQLNLQMFNTYNQPNSNIDNIN